MENLNYLDIIIMCFLLYGIIRGAMSGLVRQALSLAGLVIAVFCSQFVAIPIDSLLNTLFQVPANIAKPLAFCFAFLLILLACEICIRLLDKILAITRLSGINRILGVVFCELKIIVILSVAINIYELFDKESKLIGQNVKEESLLYPPVQEAAPFLFSLVAKEINWESLKKRINPNKEEEANVLSKTVLTHTEQNDYGTRYI